MQPEEIPRTSAGLRGAFQFRQAIDLIDPNLESFSETIALNLGSRSSTEPQEVASPRRRSGMPEELLELDPDLPSARKFPGDGGETGR